MADANSRGWGSGWPNCQGGNQVTVNVTGGARLPVHRDVAELVRTLCEATVARGYQIRQADSGGFNCRSIRNSNRPSNHSWGLAVDLNWKTNPHQRTLVTDMPDWMPEMWQQCGFRWGGTYKKPDTMHYEYMGTPQQVAAHLAAARTFLDGRVLDPQAEERPHPDVLGMPPYGGKVLKSGSQGDAVRTWQERMKARGWRIEPTGVFDARTKEVCEKFQKEKGLLVDGKVGRQTWTAAWALPVT
jgi:hypothetical protein